MRNKFFLSLAVLAIGAVSQADVVLDHMANTQADAGNIFASQDFEAAFAAFDISVIEDFSVTASQTLVTKVDVMMAGFSGFTSPATWASVTGYRLNFYSSIAAATANLTGDLGAMTLTPGQVTMTDPGFSIWNSTVRRISVNTNIVLPGAGTYWVGVMAILDAGQAVNQVGVIENLATSGGDNAHQVNPAGGFGLGGGSNFASIATDAAYRVEATAVPEPASMIALGLGAAALAARRRRKVA